jgi:uncharacterized protein YegL
MKKNYTHIAVVLDRSGSMQHIASDVIGGFNSFIEEQQKVPGEATITTVRFDNEYEVMQEFKNLNDSLKLDTSNYQPRGMTALNDAIGRTIISTGERLRKMKEEDRPEKVIFVIQTDGLENASQEFTGDAVKKMVEHQSDSYQWKFVYLGANQDAVLTGAALGIKGGDSMTYAANSLGVAANTRALNKNMSAYRTMAADVAACSNFVEESDRVEQEEILKGVTTPVTPAKPKAKAKAAKPVKSAK